jgi:integrase
MATPSENTSAGLKTRHVFLDTSRQNRYGHRDATMILIAFRHGLRASELVDVRWDQIAFATANLHVRRVKQGTPSTHPLLGDELRALRRLQREQEPRSPFVLTSERGAPFSTAGFAHQDRMDYRLKAHIWTALRVTGDAAMRRYSRSLRRIGHQS